MGGVGKHGQIQVGHISQDIDISLLGANSVASVQLGDVLTQQFRLARVKGWVMGDALTADVGPVVFGLAHPQLTIAEIDGAMSVFPSAKMDLGDADTANRPVYPLAALGSAGEGSMELMAFDSKDWPFGGMTCGEELNMFNVFAWNADQVSAFGTTTGINFYFKYWGVWI